MKRASDKRRVLLAITETSSLSTLWRVVTQQAEGEQTELVTVFVCDDRWHRAASLPFTREVSRVSGGSENFTPQRAQQIKEDTVGRKHRELEELAKEAELPFDFEVLAEHDAAKLEEFVSVEQDVLIAPSFLKSRPIYAELTRLKCRILFVDEEEEDDESPEKTT